MDLKKLTVDELVKLQEKISKEIKDRKKKLTLRAKKVKDSYYLEIYHREGAELVRQYIGKIGNEKTLRKVGEIDKEKPGVLQDYLELMSELGFGDVEIWISRILSMCCSFCWDGMWYNGVR